MTFSDHPFKSGGHERKARMNSSVIAHSVYTQLHDAILSAELRPNQRLVEDELARWLNVSRTPIREALLLLEKEGHVERNRGWIVREHDPAEIKQRFECRIAIEGFATRLAALSRSDADLQQLEQLVMMMEEAEITRLRFNQLNIEFHKLIVTAAQNPTLADLHSQTRMNYWDMSVPIVFSSGEYQTFQEQHRQIVLAIRQRDAASAESLARTHIQLTMEIVMDALGVKGQTFQR